MSCSNKIFAYIFDSGRIESSFYGEAVFGFGQAYNLGGENFEEFVQRQNIQNTGHGK